MRWLDKTVDWMVDHVSPVFLVVFLICLILFGAAWCVAKAEEIDGDKFNTDLLYCQEFSKWGHDIMSLTNQGVEAKDYFPAMYNQLALEVQGGITTPEDSALVVMMAWTIFNDPQYKGYGVNQLKLDFYNECMENRGHKRTKKLPHTGEIQA